MFQFIFQEEVNVSIQQIITHYVNRKFLIKTINVSLLVSHIFRKIASRLRQIRLHRFSNSVSILGQLFLINHLFGFSYSPILTETRNKIQQNTFLSWENLFSLFCSRISHRRRSHDDLKTDLVGLIN